MSTKIICRTLEGGFIQSNSYQGPSGQSYNFHRHTPTVINNKEDADYFLNCGKGTLFKKITKTGEIIEDLKEALAEVAKDFHFDKKEEKPKEIPKEEAPKEEAPKEESKPTEKLFTAEELEAMNKKEQIEHIKRLGGADRPIPGLEKERIYLILKLQKQLSNLNFIFY